LRLQIPGFQISEADAFGAGMLESGILQSENPLRLRLRRAGGCHYSNITPAVKARYFSSFCGGMKARLASGLPSLFAPGAKMNAFIGRTSRWIDLGRRGVRSIDPRPTAGHAPHDAAGRGGKPVKTRSHPISSSATPLS